MSDDTPKVRGIAGTITTLTFDRDSDLITLNLADQQGVQDVVPIRDGARA